MQMSIVHEYVCVSDDRWHLDPPPRIEDPPGASRSKPRGGFYSGWVFPFSCVHFYVKRGLVFGTIVKTEGVGSIGGGGIIRGGGFSSGGLHATKRKSPHQFDFFLQSNQYYQHQQPPSYPPHIMQGYGAMQMPFGEAEQPQPSGYYLGGFDQHQQHLHMHQRQQQCFICLKCHTLFNISQCVCEGTRLIPPSPLAPPRLGLNQARSASH